uniref:Uncharacterized protein n=1 Tax=Arundo donax TaxID=35708 RepID=A0A0A8ZQ88_ARUDO
MVTAGGDEHSGYRSLNLSNLWHFLLLIDGVELPLRYEETDAVSNKDRGGEKHNGNKDRGSGEIQGDLNEKECSLGEGGP